MNQNLNIQKQEVIRQLGALNQEQREVFEAHVKSLAGDKPDEFLDAMQKSGGIFAKLSGKRPERRDEVRYVPIDSHCCHYSTTNDFWFWMYMLNTPPYYGPHHCHGGGGYHGCGGGGWDHLDGDTAVVIAGIVVVLADLAAIVAAVSVTSDAINEAGQAKKMKEEVDGVADSLDNNASSQIKEKVKKLTRRLKSMAKRRLRCRRIKALGVGAMAAAGVGMVHAIVSAIGLAILAGASNTAAASGAAVFFSASVCPPVLIAIAAIFVVGLILYAASKYYESHKNKQEAEEALKELKEITQTGNLDTKLKELNRRGEHLNQQLDSIQQQIEKAEARARKAEQAARQADIDAQLAALDAQREAARRAANGNALYQAAMT